MEFRYIYNPKQAEYFLKRGVKLDHIYKNCHIFLYDEICEQAFIEWKNRKLQNV
jgi:hypothetical protein